jgi:hypothetical protein
MRYAASVLPDPPSGLTWKKRSMKSMSDPF